MQPFLFTRCFRRCLRRFCRLTVFLPLMLLFLLCFLSLQAQEAEETIVLPTIEMKSSAQGALVPDADAERATYAVTPDGVNLLDLQKVVDRKNIIAALCWVAAFGLFILCLAAMLSRPRANKPPMTK